MGEGYQQLSRDERKQIQQLSEAKAPVAAIARRLGRHRSTIYREVKRNYFRDKQMPDIDGYWFLSAHEIARNRRRRRAKLMRDAALRDRVVDCLKVGWSPEQISGRLRLAGVEAVSHETIYRYVYSDAGMRQSLACYLPERRKRRRPRYKRKRQQNVFPDAVSIKCRPESVGTRSEAGHWEGDLIQFTRDQGSENVAVFVERQSRYTALIRNKDRRTAPLMKRIVEVFEDLPASARRSFTFDRGFEFMGWRTLKTKLGSDVWFCNPSAPWQKGTVENTNRRIRRYLPRSFPIAAASDDAIDDLSDFLNVTPRKCLGFRTPEEVLTEIIGGQGL